MSWWCTFRRLASGIALPRKLKVEITRNTSCRRSSDTRNWNLNGAPLCGCHALGILH